MFDGIHACGHGVVGALQRHGVSCDLVPLTMSLIYGGANLIQREGWNVV